MVKSDIVSILSKNGYYKAQASDVFDDLFRVIRSGIENGETARIPDFGTFEVKKRKGHLIQNPQTKQKMMTDDYFDVTFKPCTSMKSRIKETKLEQ